MLISLAVGPVATDRPGTEYVQPPVDPGPVRLRLGIPIQGAPVGRDSPQHSCRISGVGVCLKEVEELMSLCRGSRSIGEADSPDSHERKSLFVQVRVTAGQEEVVDQVLPVLFDSLDPAVWVRAADVVDHSEYPTIFLSSSTSMGCDQVAGRQVLGDMKGVRESLQQGTMNAVLSHPAEVAFYC